VTGSRELAIGAELLAAVLSHARAELPNEACGLLAGATISGTARAFHPARNAHASPYRYSIEPQDLVRITFDIERAGDGLLAIVHSHPRSPAVPSWTDVRAAQLYPGTPQLIVSLAAERDGEPFRAWRIGPGSMEELTIRIDQPPVSTSMISPVARSRSASKRGAPSSPPDR
jgi:proteasome lid subunit RPN8/RPN11